MATKRKRGPGLGEAIREEVARRGSSLERASVELGFSVNAFQRWTQLIEPNADAYDVLMDYLGVNLDQLGGLILEDKIRRWELKRQR